MIQFKAFVFDAGWMLSNIMAGILFLDESLNTKLRQSALILDSLFYLVRSLGVIDVLFFIPIFLINMTTIISCQILFNIISHFIFNLRYFILPILYVVFGIVLFLNQVYPLPCSHLFKG